MKSTKRKNVKSAMKGVLATAALGWMCWGAGTTCLAQTTAANLSPDLQEVVKLSQQKMSDDIITSYIKNTGHPFKLGADDILRYAQQVPQLDGDRFKACLKADEFTGAVKKAVADANAQGISGTPTFLIGKTQGDVVDGVLVVGAKPIAEFETMFKEESRKSASNP